MSQKRSLATDAPSSAAKRPAPWFLGLAETMKDPKQKLFEDDRLVVIADKYPKARFHFLILPKNPIANLNALNESHIPLIQHMIAEGENFTKTNISPKTKNAVRMGFHSIPSMETLHMHIISQDFDSVCLKNKKHWNSFTTGFFISAETLLEMLRKKGAANVDKSRAESYIKESLRCNVCKTALQNIPKLKEHLKVHDKDRNSVKAAES